MASSSNQGISFNVVQDIQPFRLLELPSELLELLSTSNPPTLQLKSATPLETQDGPPTPVSKSQSNLHLVTQTKSYEVRQVNTSNSVYVVEASGNRASTGLISGSNVEATTALVGNTPALSAIGQVSSVLEVQPTSYNAHHLLKQRLRTWTGPDSSVPSRDPLMSSTKASVFSDIPCPDQEIEKAWKDLAAVETMYQGHTVCLRPSAVAARDGWKSLVQGCLAEGMDLSLTTSTQTILSSYDARLEGSPEGEIELEIAQALLECLGDTTTEGYRLSKEKIVRWIGAKLLQASYEERAAWDVERDRPQREELSSFLQSWRELLPEAWREEAKVASLGAQMHGRYRIIEDEGCLEYWQAVGDESFIFGGVTTDNIRSTTAAKTDSTTVGKRKWHEKFKEMRDKKAR